MSIELDDSGGVVQIRLTLPQDTFTVAELRAFAAYLNTVADEAEPSPEVQELAGILESAELITQNSRATARAILGAGYSRQQPPIMTDGIRPR